MSSFKNAFDFLLCSFQEKNKNLLKKTQDKDNRKCLRHVASNKLLLKGIQLVHKTVW